MQDSSRFEEASPAWGRAKSLKKRSHYSFVSKILRETYGNLTWWNSRWSRWIWPQNSSSDDSCIIELNHNTVFGWISETIQPPATQAALGLHNVWDVAFRFGGCGFAWEQLTLGSCSRREWLDFRFRLRKVPLLTSEEQSDLVTSASLVVTSALLVVTKKLLELK